MGGGGLCFPAAVLHSLQSLLRQKDSKGRERFSKISRVGPVRHCKTFQAHPVSFSLNKDAFGLTMCDGRKLPFPLVQD